uniref:Uncharacterized protein n=1 Tax=viral metagenome TaxID=1070528 RepID=A0A6H1ZP01_9ZZZZ
MGSLIDKKTKDAIDGLNKIAVLLDKEETRQIKDSMDKKKNTWSASDYVATALTLTNQTIRKLDESKIMREAQIDRELDRLRQVEKNYTEMAENYLKKTAIIARIREWADNNSPANSSLFDILNGDKIWK